jgi:hypothetical protein
MKNLQANINILRGQLNKRILAKRAKGKIKLIHKSLLVG